MLNVLGTRGTATIGWAELFPESVQKKKALSAQCFFSTRGTSTVGCAKLVLNFISSDDKLYKSWFAKCSLNFMFLLNA